MAQRWTPTQVPSKRVEGTFWAADSPSGPGVMSRLKTEQTAIARMGGSPCEAYVTLNEICTGLTGSGFDEQ